MVEELEPTVAILENDDNLTVETNSNFADDREHCPYISDPKLLTRIYLSDFPCFGLSDFPCFGLTKSSTFLTLPLESG